MSNPLTTTLTRLAVAACVAGVTLGVTSPGASAAYDPADPVQKQAYDSAFSIAQDAYQFGIPLLNMRKTFENNTSTNVSTGRGFGPVNQFNHFNKLADASDRAVVAPNSDTLYSIAWLDLSRQPQVIHSVKGTKRFHVLPLMSPYQEDFQNIGSPGNALPDGDYLVTGPGFTGKVPAGLRRIRSPYNRVWIIGRTYNNGAADLAATRKTMNGYKVTPLNRWNPKRPYAYTPPKPKTVDSTVDVKHVVGTGPGEDPATFFDALGDELQKFPPPAADAAMLTRIKTLGIGSGLHPTSGGTLSDPQLQAMRDAVTGGPVRTQGALAKIFLDGFEAHNGWVALRTGTYGTDYSLRAVVDKTGLGAPTPDVSVYPITLTDRDKSPLTGAKRYVAHFASAPPVKFFWSMTLYDNDGFFIVNPAKKWLVNDRTGLKTNADGSFDVYIQPDAPTDPAQRTNWLPSPQPTAATTGFRLIARLYGLTPQGISGVVSGSGWQAPTVLPCGPDNKTRTGITCAS